MCARKIDFLRMFINERYDFADMTGYNVPGPNDVGIGPILRYCKT
jgi:hypothetical protein